MKKITQSEFIRQYCDKSNISEDELNRLGQLAVPCDCGEDDCRGWAMISRENLQSQIDLYIKS